jgi:O-antigen/teichoic acid export membrane protein
MNRIVLLNALEVGAKAASLILLLAFIVWFRLGVVGVVLANVLVVVGTAAIMVAVLRHMGAWGRPSFDRSFCRRTGRFALSAYVGMIMTYLNYRFDQFIIAAFLPPEQLGFYVISVGLAERLWVLPGSVGTALLPHLTNSGQRDAAISATVARHIMAWMGLCCLLVFVLAEVIVTGLYSTAFGPAVAPLRWLLPGIFTLTAGKVLVAELLAREKIRYTVWAGVTSVLANVVGNLLLVPRMGIAGAALASSISYTVVSLMVSWYYVRETGLPWSSFLPRRSDLETYRTLWRRGSGLAALLGRAS